VLVALMHVNASSVKQWPVCRTTHSLRAMRRSQWDCVNETLAKCKAAVLQRKPLSCSARGSRLHV